MCAIVNAKDYNYTKLDHAELFSLSTVELQWLKHAWDHENWFQSNVVINSTLGTLVPLWGGGGLRSVFSCGYFHFLFL